MTLTCPNCGQQAGRKRKATLSPRFTEHFIPWKGDGEWEIIGTQHSKGSYTYECEHCGTTVRKHKGLSKQKRRRANHSPKTGRPVCGACGGTGAQHVEPWMVPRSYRRWVSGESRYTDKPSQKTMDKVRRLKEQSDDDCGRCNGKGRAWPKNWVKGDSERNL